MLLSFGVILTELGDKSQRLAMPFADPVPRAHGARRDLDRDAHRPCRVLPERAIRVFAAAAFVVFGVILIAEGPGLLR